MTGYEADGKVVIYLDRVRGYIQDFCRLIIYQSVYALQECRSETKLLLMGYEADDKAVIDLDHVHGYIRDFRRLIINRPLLQECRDENEIDLIKRTAKYPDRRPHTSPVTHQKNVFDWLASFGFISFR
jgi:hypothetical protein